MVFGSKSARTSPLPRDWKRIRAAVLERDGWRCTEVRGDTGRRCDARATDVDHMGDPDDHRLCMLRSLCAHHHRRVTGRQGGGAVRKRAKVETPRHPGLRSVRVGK